MKKQTATQKLHTQFMKYLNRKKISNSQIKNGKVKNPFPVGTRVVDEFARKKIATASSKWKLFCFLNKTE